MNIVQIAALVEQKRAADENTDDEAKLADADETTAELASTSNSHEKPDINDVPVEENQVICVPISFWLYWWSIDMSRVVYIQAIAFSIKICLLYTSPSPRD